MKKIFVAGGTSELSEVAAAIDALRAAGWTITADWPEMRKKEPAHLTQGQLYEIGGVLENALISANMLWVLLPREKSEGSAYELGFFRGLLASHANPSKGVIVSGPAGELGRLYPCRAAAQGRIFGEHIEALEYLIGMA